MVRFSEALPNSGVDNVSHYRPDDPFHIVGPVGTKIPKELEPSVHF